MKKGFETLNKDRLHTKIAKEHKICDICGQPLDPLGRFEYWKTRGKREIWAHTECLKKEGVIR